MKKLLINAISTQGVERSGKRLVLASFIYIACTIQAQGQTPKPFVTTWEVTAGDLSITIPTDDDFTYAYTVDWGDNTTDSTTYMDDATYTYQAAGTYTVSISGDFPAIYFNDRSPQAGDNSLKIKTIKSWGTQRWLTLNDAFEGCENLTTIEDGAGVPNLTMVTNMSDAFRGATSFNGDLSSWNVSNVNDMSSAFRDAAIFNQDISSWNVSNVTNMSFTFSDATSFNQDLSSWNVSNVITMRQTFDDATSFNGDLSSWDVSNVTSMRSTFNAATSFNGNLSTWNVSNVISMLSTFEGATSFNQDISSWNVSKVTSMVGTFEGATSFNQDISRWNVSKLTNIVGTFENATSFNQDISSWNVSNVTSMFRTFEGATSFNQDLSSWNVSNVATMRDTFKGATSFNQDISSWNVSKITNIWGTFQDATSFNSDLSTWDVSNVTDMESTFEGATSFNQDLSNWNVSTVDFMTDMLTNATSFSSENYDALLTGWSGLSSLQDDVDFTAPPTTYCSGKDGRDKLTRAIADGGYNWLITGDLGEDCSATPTTTPFVTTWEVADDGNTATTDDLSITIPTKDSLTYDYTVDWGDGTTDSTTYMGDATHTYSAAGTYTVSISGDFPAIYFDNSAPVVGDNSLKIKTIKSWGTQRWLTLEEAFEGCQNLTTIEDGAGVPDLTMVTDMSYMLSKTTNFNGDLSEWDVSKVTNMKRTFSKATSFNGDISNWNVSQVTTMRKMLLNANNFTSDLSGWDISNVTDMSNMFKNANSFSTENYDALLMGWSSLPSLLNGVTFGAPPTTYCNGKTGRGILTGTYNWTITGDTGEDCTATSVDEEFLSNTKIYPNPSNGKISIESSFEIDKLELYNVLGAKLFSVSKTNVLDLTSLSQGIYILKVFSGDRVISKKVIKD